MQFLFFHKSRLQSLIERKKEKEKERKRERERKKEKNERTKERMKERKRVDVSPNFRLWELGEEKILNCYSSEEFGSESEAIFYFDIPFKTRKEKR